jgi:hypothetical protein
MIHITRNMCLAALGAMLFLAPWAICQQNLQAFSQTGLLPIFALDLQIDPSWVDGASAPSQSPQFSHNGVTDTLQQIWESVRSGGFNMLRFPLQVDDPQSAARLVNLCLWAKANNLTLIPILQETATARKDPSAVSNLISGFVANVVALMRQTDPSLAAYTQISYYQLEGPLNHLGVYPGMNSDVAQQMLLAASAALRQSETAALQGTGAQATPTLITASLDFELVQQGAIAGVALDPAAEQMAQDSLRRFLTPLAAADSIEGLNVEWFPRSISSGDVDRFTSLLSMLSTSYSGKQLTFTTGFSSAFNPTDQQMHFYAAALSTMASLRTSQGASSNFLGVVFRQALKGPGADAVAPAGSIDPTRWNWSDKAKQLSAMWSQGVSSEEMSWWLSKVQDSMGLVAVQGSGASLNITVLPAAQAFQEISSTLAQATQATQVSPNGVLPAGVPTAPSVVSRAPISTNSVAQTNFVQPSATAVYPAPAEQAATSPFQQLLLTLVQQLATQMLNKVAPNLTNANNPNPQIAASGVVNMATVYSSFVPATSSPIVSAPPVTAFTPTAPPDVTGGTTVPAVSQPVGTTPQAATPGGQPITVIAPVFNITGVPVTGTPTAPATTATGSNVVPSSTSANGSDTSPNVANSGNPASPNNPAGNIAVPTVDSSANARSNTTSNPTSVPSDPASVVPVPSTGDTGVTNTPSGTTPSGVNTPNPGPDPVVNNFVQTQGTSWTQGTSGTQGTGNSTSLNVRVGVIAPPAIIQDRLSVSPRANATVSQPQGQSEAAATRGASEAPANPPTARGGVRAVTPAAPASTANTTAPAAQPQVGPTPATTVPVTPRTMPAVRAIPSAVPPASVTSANAAAPMAVPQPATPAAAQNAPAPPSTATNPQTRTITGTPPPANPPVPAAATRAVTPTSAVVFPPPAANRQAVAAPRTVGNVAAAGPAGIVDLAVLAQDIHLNPAAPRPGQPTTFTAVIRNLGTLPAQSASVVFRLLADGRQAAISPPIAFGLAGHAAYQASWSAVIPAGSGLQLVVTITANGDTNPVNNQILVPLTIPAAKTRP